MYFIHHNYNKEEEALDNLHKSPYHSTNSSSSDLLSKGNG